MHIGPYDAMEPAYAALASQVSERDGQLGGDPWEVYFSLTRSSGLTPSTWRTELVQPYRIR